MLTPGSSPAVDQVLVGDLADRPGRDAGDDLAWADGPDHGRPRGDERLLADLDAGADDGAPSDPAGAAQDGAAQALPRRMPTHRVVVGEHDSGAEEDVFLEHAAAGDVAAGLNA